jgi:hypothetical protein
MKRFFLLPFFFLLIVGNVKTTWGQSHASDLVVKQLSLSGEWRYQLDRQKLGIAQKWFEKELAQTGFKMPGTLNDNKIGKEVSDQPIPPTSDEYVFHYDPPDIIEYWRANYEYVGYAWYQRDIEIPANWNGKSVLLFLERTQQVSKVWVDDNFVGEFGSICAPHSYDLSSFIVPGKRQQLTILIDNSDVFHLATFNHGYSMQSQTLWNGIIGKIELQISDPVNIKDVQIYPDINNNKVLAKILLRNQLEKSVNVKVRLKAIFKGKTPNPDLPVIEKSITLSALSQKEECLDYLMGNDVKLWDEFSPNLYDLKVELLAENNLYDSKIVTFGMREITIEGTQFAINGRKIYLRGNHDQMVFPETGYPAMEKPEWIKRYKMLKEYGFNFVQYHSWTPPKVAFEVADSMGIYVCNALPLWPTLSHNFGAYKEMYDYLPTEAFHVVNSFGNHACFLFEVMGEEVEGGAQFIYRTMTLLKQHDPRHLYSLSTGYPQSYPQRNYKQEDFVVTLQGWNKEYCRLGYIDDHNPLPLTGNDFDFSTFLKNNSIKPAIATEIGEWCVYPDVRIIDKFKGGIIPLNFMVIEKDLKDKGLLPRIDDFVKNSGKQCMLMYKEDIEAELRTRGLSGFQILMFQDFPGQATCTVGMVDMFWESKGLITPEAFSGFCNSTVPLIRFPKRIYQSNDFFEAKVEIAHFGPTDLLSVSPQWMISNAVGQKLFSGTLESKKISTGENTEFSSIKVKLQNITTAQKLLVTVSLPGTEFKNSWDIWVYPKQDPKQEKGLLAKGKLWISGSLDKKTMAQLHAGGNVLLLPGLNDLIGADLTLYRPVFWSPAWIPSPEKMGITAHADHPVFKGFPTESWANLQWMDLLDHGSNMNLNALHLNFKSIIEVIPNWTKNDRLSIMLEARVGKGKLLICSVDLTNNLNNRPSARQLRQSILDYMANGDFEPNQNLTISELGSFVKITE